MALIERGICKIESINSDGEGVSPQGPIAYTLEREEVIYEKHRYRNNTKTLLKEIIVASVDRVKPECEYFGRCGGCSLQHMKRSKYQEFKYSLLQDNFFLKNIDPNNLVSPVRILAPQNNRRRRVNLVFVKKSQEVLLGFYKAGTNDIVSARRCIACDEDISRLILPIREYLDVILEENQKGEIFILKARNGIEIQIYLESDRIIDQKSIKKWNILLNINKSIGVIDSEIISMSFYQNKNLKLYYQKARPFITFGSVNVNVTADSFIQPTEDSDKLLSDIIIEFLALDANTNGNSIKIVDLFSGRGTYSIRLAKVLGEMSLKSKKKNLFEVHAYEFDDKAIRDLKNASQNLPLKIFKRDLIYHPLYNRSTVEVDSHHRYDYAIINPPRTGAENQSILLASSSLQKIVYVSCCIETFKRDAEILLKNYKITNLIGVDQFKWTKHLEVICCFEKIS